MTKQEFMQYLAHPEQLNGQSIALLKKMVQEFPYFQTGRMLYLKNLQNENSLDYEKNMHITATYAPNSKVLYNLMKKTVPPAVDLRNKQLPPVEEDKRKEQKAMEIPEVITTSSLSIYKERTSGSKNVPIPEPKTVRKDIITSLENSNPSGNKQDLPEASNDMQVLETQILHEVYRTSMTVDFFQEEENSIAAEKSRNVLLRSAPNPNNFAIDHTFNDWLKVVSTKALEVTQSDPITSGESGFTKKDKDKTTRSLLPGNITTLVKKPKASFYSADVMAKKSLQDDERFVSETLANIYLQQGNLPKARRSYEILLAKHPEKVHIFAPLLEKVKKLLEQQKDK